MQRGFTLVELLVVIAIIVILLALLTPALDRALEQAVRVKCGANFKQFSTANHIYAHEFRQQFVPIKLQHQGGPGATAYYEAWYQNRHYARIMGVTGARIVPYHNPETGQDVPLELMPEQVADLPETPNWPEAMMCPAAPDHRLDNAVLWQAQGFNWSGVMGEADWANAIVIRRTAIQRPGDKAQMVDSNDWHVVGKGWANRANYVLFWDVHGDNDWVTGYNAMVTYRHEEGAMIAHFDGHVGYYTKEHAWRDPEEVNAELWDVKAWGP